QVGGLTNQPNRDAPLALVRSLEDARIQYGSFVARVGSDQEEGVGLVDAGDGRIEQIGGAAESGIERRPVLAAIDIRRAEFAREELERKHLLASREISGDCRKARAVEAFELGRYDLEGLIPARRLEPAIPPHIGPVEALRAKAVPHMAGLVGNP